MIPKKIASVAIICVLRIFTKGRQSGVQSTSNGIETVTKARDENKLPEKKCVQTGSKFS